MTFARSDLRAYDRTHTKLRAEVASYPINADMGAVLTSAFGRDDAWSEHIAINALREAGYRPMAIVEHIDAARRVMNANRRRVGWQEI